MADYLLGYTGNQVDSLLDSENNTAARLVYYGVVDGWTIMRWSNKWVEMYKRDTVTTDVKTAAGALYCSDELTASLPTGVLASIVNIDVRPIGGINYLMVAQITGAAATNGNFTYSLISSWSHTSTNRTMQYRVVGWAMT